MAARARRCHRQWGHHYKLCQQSIEAAMARCTSQQTALIFGAGSLQDVPLELLAQNFKQVILVDLLFLKAARKRAQAFHNIQLIEADVTESISALFNGKMTLTTPQRWLTDSTVSLVVSLNLITQLPLLPAKWLLKHAGATELEVESLSKQLIQQHIDYLCTFSCTVCLIADRLNSEFDASGKIIDEFDPWWGVGSPATIEEWDWELVPIGESQRKVAGKRIGQKNRVGVSYLTTN